MDYEKNKKKVYDALVGMRVSGIGKDFNEFSTLLDNEKNRETVYGALKKKGVGGIGKDFNEFSTLITSGVPKSGETQPQDSHYNGILKVAGDAHKMLGGEMDEDMQHLYDSRSRTAAAYDVLYDEKNRLEDMRKTTRDKMAQRRAELTTQSGMYQYGMAPITMNKAAEATDSEMTKLLATENQLNQAIRNVDRRMKGEDPGFWDGVADATLHNAGFWTMGLSDLADSRALVNISENGIKSDTDRTLAEAMVSNKEHAGDGVGYGLGNIVGNSVPFMIQMIATGGMQGVSKLGAAAAKKFAKDAISHRILRATGALADDFVEAAMIANTAGLPQTLANINERRAGKINLDENGDYRFDDKAGWLEAAYKGEMSSILEVFSEKLGNHLDGKMPLAKGLDKIGASKLSKALTVATKNDIAQGAGTVLKQFGVNGLLPEILEEEGNLIMNSVLVGDNEISDLWDAEKQRDIIGGIALSVGTMRAIPGAIGSVGYMKNQRALKEADAEAAEVFGERWEQMRELLNGASNERVARVLTSMDVDEKARPALLEYYKRMMTMRGYNIGTVKREEIAPNIEQAYWSGYNLSDDGLTNARDMYDIEREEAIGELGEEVVGHLDRNPEEAMKGLGEKEKRKAQDYLLAQAKFEGVTDRVRDDIKEKVQASDKEIDSHTRKDGTVRPATLKDGRKVYVMKGNVATFDNGIINEAESDGSIIVLDAETGKKEFSAPNLVQSVDGSIDAKQEKEAMRKQITNEYATERADVIDGVLPFNPGDVYRLSIGGEIVEASVIADNGNGSVTININGEQVILPKSKAQSLARNARLETLRAQRTQAGVAAEKTDGYRVGSVFYIDVNGEKVRGEIEDVTADGVQIRTDLPVNGKRVQVLPKEQFEQLVGQPTEETVATVAAEEPTADTNEPAAPKTALEQIPRNEKNVPLYEQVDSELAWDGVVEEAGGNEETAMVAVNSMIADKQDALKKAEKAKAKVGVTIAEKIAAENERVANIEKAKADLAKWEEIAGVKAKRAAAQAENVAQPVAETAPVEEVEAPQATNEMQEADLENAEKGEKGQKAVEPVGETDSSTLSQTSEQVGDIAAEVQAAEAEVNTAPTDKQKEAGNYKKGHVRIGAFNVTIEQPRGSVRSGVDKGGKKWEVEMQNTYGYIRGTEGVDGDHIDVFLSNDIDGWNGRQVYIIDQRNADGSFDEHKVMLGFNDINEAEEAYLSNYEQGWQGLGAITGVATKDFEKWIASSHRKTKAFAEYKSIKTAEGQSAPGQSGVVDNQGNPVDANGKLIVEEVASIDEITDEDFETPTRSVQLPTIPENVASAIGAEGRPVVIKKNVFTKNSETHVELEPEDSRNILRSALYNPNLIGSTQPIKRPDYKVAIRTGEQNAVVVLDVYQEKDFVEIVGWRMVNEKGLAKMQRQAEREGGQFLILSPNDGLAAALSALPLGLSSASEGTTQSAKVQENSVKSKEIAPEQSDAPYTIAPAQYTTKKGKVLDMHLVNFAGTLTKEQQRAAKELAKADKGWYDREQGGFMMRSEESAKQLADTILNNEDAVSDAQPVSMADIQALNNGDVLFTEPQQVEQAESEDKSPVWQYSIHIDADGYTTISRDDVRGVYPISDAHFRYSTNSPEEMLDILRNPLNGMQEVLEAVGVTLENKIKTRELDRKIKEEREQKRAELRTNGVNGYKIGEKVVYTPASGTRKAINATIHDFEEFGDNKPVLDIGLAPVMYEVVEWSDIAKVESSKTALLDDEGAADDKTLALSSIGKTFTRMGETESGKPYEETLTFTGQKGGYITAEMNTVGYGGSVKMNVAEAAEALRNGRWQAKITTESKNEGQFGLVSDERMTELKERLRKKLGGQMNIGIDPEILAIGLEIAVGHLDRGVKTFTDFAKVMISDLGDVIRPYLKAFYNGARELPEVIENGLASDMTSYDEVQTFDVANFDKQTTNAIAAAETIAREQDVNKEVEIAQERIKKTRNNKKDNKNSVTSQPNQFNLFDNGTENQNTAADNSGARLGREELSDTEQVGAGASVQDTARDSKRKRRNAGVGSSKLGDGPQYDVNRNYTNEEIEEIVSSITDIVDGRVVISGEVTDDIKAIVRGYESGGVAKKGRGILDEYYTDGKIVDAVNLLIAPYFNNTTPIRVLEPSVGVGNFIEAVNNIPTSEIAAFEINETTARIAKILYPDVDVNLRSFETEFIDESGNKKTLPKKFNLVIGNPPYGSHRGLYKGLGEESKIARYEDYFVKRSLDILNEGGILAMVLPSSWIDRHTKYGGYTIEVAYRLPSGAFEATQVGTDIVILKKDSSVPVMERTPYFEQFPERVLGEVKERKGRYGKTEEYVEGDIDAAIEAIKKENAGRLADLLNIEKNNDNLNDIEAAVDETGSTEKAAAVVKDALDSENIDNKPAAKTSDKQDKYKMVLSRGVETVPTSAQFTHEFSEGEVEAFADTDYEGALSNLDKHKRYANYIGGQAIHDFYYAEGDIYSKLAQLEQEKNIIIKNFGVEQYEKQKALLESVLPKQKSLEEVTISPNTAFVKNLNILTEGGRVSLKDMFVDFCRRLPQQAFGDSSPWEVVGYINNEQVHGTDKNRNQRIRERRKRIANDLFSKFLNEELSDNAKKQVVAAFNREYNSTYRPDYSKVPMFSTINRDFKGKPLKLTSVQLAGIGRMTVKGVGVLAHEVGFGKTLSGVLAMHEAMTRGFAQKPLIVVPNDNILKQWVETIGEVLPNATVNTLGNLGTGYDLTNFKVNDGEFTIITYEGLKAMSFSDGTYDHLASKFSYITEDLNKHKSERDIQKGIEKKNELKGKMKRGTKSSYMFEDFGFDWLTVDEVHNANHIVSKVRLDKSVASDFRSQSQRTSDLGLKTWLAAQYIQEENNGRNVLLLSATPFTNKPLEYYSILSLVGNKMLERKGFFNVDQFFATFMEADNELEIGANGRPTQKTNVRRFRNNGLFQQLLSEFIDIKGEEDNPELVRPERLNKEYKIAQNELTAEAMAAAQELLSDNDTVLQGIGHARAAAFSPYATSLLGRQPKNHVEFVRNSPKIDATIKMIEQNIKDRPDAGQIIYSEVGVEFFPMIRDYLVKESGLKPNEVRIITGATSNNERVNIQTAFNDGEVKVVIGSPAIKEGLNLQGNTTDMYILSLPWNFTQLRQIEGRGWRQGNKWENIRINYMLTNNSVDVFMLQRLQLKQGLYNEAMKSGAESLDVGDIDTAELKTALITDPAVRAEIVTVQEREKLQLEKMQIEADLSFVMRKYEAYNKLLDKLESQKNSIKMYKEWAQRGDEYWAQRAEREEAQLQSIENEIEEEKLNLLKKGVNVDDIVRQTEQAQNAIAAIQEKIENLKEFQEELTERFREESEAKAKEQGDLVSTYIKERKAENKGGFYRIRPEKTEAKATEEETEDDVLYRSAEDIETEYPNWLEGTTTDSKVVMDSDPYSKALGRPRYTGKRQREYVARQRRRMTDKARQVAEKLNLDNVEVLESTEGLTGKKATSKGWFDPRTGKITVVVPNHGSTGDIVETVLHEAVAHYGLRQLFGENFDTFLDNVYRMADADVRAEITEMARVRGWDFHTATEEYLASLAENTNFENINASWWQKIKELFLKMLDKIGISGYDGPTLSDNELRYILWRSYQNLQNPGAYRNVFAEAENIAKQYELKVGNYANATEEATSVAERPYRYVGGNMGVVSDFRREHRGTANVIIIYPNIIFQQLYDQGFSVEEISKILKRSEKNGEAFYNHERNTVYLLDKNLNEKKIKAILWHEGVHTAIAHLGITEDELSEQYNSVTGKIKEVFEKEAKEAEYKEDEYPEEFIAYCIQYIYENGIINSENYDIRHKTITNIPKELTEFIQPIINYIKYGRKEGERQRGDSVRFYRINEKKPDRGLYDTVRKENGEGEEGADDTLFREGDPEAHRRTLARERYEQRMKEGGFQMQEALQDSMLSLKEAMKAILGDDTEIEDVAGFENAYIGENRLASTNKAEADAMANTLFKPLLEEVARLAPTKEERMDLTDYMFAKHGLERNAYMRAEAVKNGDKRANKRDFAGLTALTGMDNVADAEAEAMRMVEDYEKNHNTTILWKRVNAISKAILQKSKECGMMNQETYDKISGMYEFYIPLRGFDERTSKDAYAYLTHRESAFNAPIKTAKGRGSKADDPFANLQSMAESAIMQGNRNKLVKQRFLNFVLNNPSDLVSVSELWVEFDETRDEWRPVFPNNINSNDSPADVERKMQEFEERMEILAQQNPDKYKHGKDAVALPYRIEAKRDMREHQVIVRRNGRDILLTVNGNPRLAQALNGLTNPDNDVSGAIGAILGAGEWVNRKLSALYTTRNPDFIVSNFLRDLLYTNSMVWVKESPRYALRFHRNYITKANPADMKRMLAKYRMGTLDMNDKTEEMFYLFMINGGETGYVNARDIEKHKKDIDRELKKLGNKISAAKALDFFKDRLDEYNRAIENSARFAAFMTSREMGRDIDRSIYDAKEISVNFNKKGSGSKFLGATGQTNLGNAAAFASGVGRVGYVFWNVAIQGTTNFGKQVKKHPKKALAAAATMFLLGALTAAMGGDDEEDKNAYYNLPDYVRRSNMMFRAGDSWISIPLPIEYRMLYGMGELMTSVLSGKEHLTGGEIAMAVAGQMTQVLPLDFLEGGGGLNAFVPSAVKPVWDAYVTEKSWTGMPLYKDYEWNKEMPEWTKSFKSGNRYIIGLSEFLNETTGGDEYTKGGIDFNPAKLEALLEGYFGGVASTIDKLVKTGETVLGEREYDPRSILLLNRVVKAGDESTEYRAVNNEFFRLKKEAENVKRRLRNYEKDTDNGVFDYAEKIDFLYNSPEYLRYEIYEFYRPLIKDITDELKEAEMFGLTEETKSLQAELIELKKDFIEEVNATRK